ncbi:ATP-binding cassette domain-containing protein [Rhodococcus koreensis]|uniref:ATP-binding cassette domain-containing protein n=1 Tax=Rhodococcus koreensis TaxID=99653 RepID=UPI00197CC9F2|nr:ATP-binding cassette domain-containing protein [Rhodococcus koreensis]QSE84867.1 ATP-binding cassette domain-containing protein [Rhodococcus koreensis]
MATALVTLAALGLIVREASWQYVLILGMAWGAVAVGMNLWQGYLGELSFGHGALVAIAAYAWTVARTAGLSPILALTICVGLTLIACGIIGLAVVQLSHFGSAVVTFFLAFVVSAGLQSSAFVDLTGSQSGLLVPDLHVLGVDFGNGVGLYYLALGFLAVVLFSSSNFGGGRRGHELRLVRSSEQVASLLGVKVKQAKWTAFVFTGLGAALAGVVIAQALTVITPDSFSAAVSITLVAMVVVGGQGTLLGPLLGALFFAALPSIFQGAPENQALYASITFLVFVVLAPAGILGALSRWGGATTKRLPSRPRTLTGTGGESGSMEACDTSSEAFDVPEVDSGRRIAGECDMAATAAAAMEIADVSVAFDGVHALSGVDITVTPGQIHALIGPNGAGKTTLINAVTGLLRPTSGEIRVNGLATTKLSPPEIRAAGVGRTFQNPSLVDDLSAVENVALGLLSQQRRWLLVDLLRPTLGRNADADTRARCEEALRLVGVSESTWNKRADEISLADRKLVDLARSFVAEPTILLLDEPTAGLGEQEIHIVEDAILKLRSNGRVTILLVAHHVAFVRRVADTVTVLDGGKILASGHPEQVTSDERVLEAFIGQPAELLNLAGEFGSTAGEPALCSPGEPADSSLADPEMLQPERSGTDLSSQGMRVTDLTVGYGPARVLDKVSLHVSRGELVGLTGRNGAGKTTLLRALSGMIGRGNGLVNMDSVTVPPSPVDAARAGLIHVPEGRGVVGSLSVLENLQVGAVAVGHKLTNEDLDHILSRFPALRPLLQRPAGLLSGGQQQMLAIARGLAAKPSILMVDELSLGLSPKATSEALQVLVRLTRESGEGVLVVDQNIQTLSSVCDRMYVLRDGSLVELEGDSGSIHELQEVYF